MPSIHLLDDVTITKIAAGEVIDRPASIVKELIENSLDAKANSIKIVIENGGIRRIKITDNGQGIAKEDLPLAPLRHATSKITSLDDIYNQFSFGFRGEALASVSHAADLTIVSNTGEQAYSITANQGKITVPEPCAGVKGTTIDVRDLFSSLPVRAKFLKKPATETAYIFETVLHYALLYPKLEFQLISNDKEMLNTSGIEELDILAAKMLSKDLSSNCIPVQESMGDIGISGLISSPKITFSNRNKLFFGVNGRLIKNPLLQKAIQVAYADVIPHRRFPLAILNITVPNATTDVNVHPQKTDIKFLNPGFIFDVVKKSVAMSIQTTMAMSLPKTSSFGPREPVPSSKQIDEAVSFFTLGATEKNNEMPEFSPWKVTHSENMATTNPSHSFEWIQVFSTYLIIKTPQSFWIMDQHAAHERILYERIKVKEKQVNHRQPLLVSEVIPLSSDLFELFLAEEKNITDLGFIIETFGTDSIVVREIPITFAEADVKSLIIDFLNAVHELPESQIDLIAERKEALQMKACKAAIKAGKRMSDPEVRQLIEDFIRSPNNFTCPHGRPLALEFTKTDLEKMFLRI